MERNIEINNTFYNELGEKWYTAQNDPVALLRAENKLIFPWVLRKIREKVPEAESILDVGCGGGFLTNKLVEHEYSVTGIDLSTESLRIAKDYDQSKRVKYICADAYHLPFPDRHFDVVTSMDFLEHVERPDLIIKEIARVIRPGGLFFFHTFNRNFISWIVVIKLVEWLIKSTPENMHLLRLFIKPDEMKHHCLSAGLEVKDLKGLRPVISSIDLKKALKGIVSPEMRFTFTRSHLISYVGMAKNIT